MQRRQSAGSISSIAASRAGDAGVVHQHVQAAELARCRLEQPVHLRLVRHVGHRRADVPVRLAGGRQGPLVHVAQVDAGAGGDHRVDDDAADTRCAGRDQHPLPIGPQLSHDPFPPQEVRSRSASTAPSTTTPKMMSRTALGSVVPASKVESAVKISTPPSMPR